MRHPSAAPDFFAVTRELPGKAHPHTFVARKDPKGGALRPINRVLTSAYLANKHAPNRQKCPTGFSVGFGCRMVVIRWVSGKFETAAPSIHSPKVARVTARKSRFQKTGSKPVKLLGVLTKPIDHDRAFRFLRPRASRFFATVNSAAAQRL